MDSGSVRSEDMKKLLDRIVDIDEINPNFSTILYGPPGVGKTYLACTAQDLLGLHPILFVNIEGGLATVRQFKKIRDVITLENWREVGKLYRELKKDTHYRTVIFDTLTEAADMNIKHIMAVKRRDNPNAARQPKYGDFWTSKDDVVGFIRDVHKLDKNVILIAHARENYTDKNVLINIRPDFNPRTSQEISRLVDNIGYLTLEVRKNGESRNLLMMPTSKVLAKHRGEPVSGTVKEPTMKKILDMLGFDYGKP